MTTTKRRRRAAGFEGMDAAYRGAVLDEMNAIGEFLSSSVYGQSKKIPLRSVYFGGGTPSLAPPSTLRAIMHAIRGESSKNNDNNALPFLLEDDAEVTIEMDPGTFDLAYLMAVRDMGFNRLSLGVQSFDDDLLATMGRVHRSADVYRSVEMIEQVFGTDSNYSIDLISGVPGLTTAGWAETLGEASRLRPRPSHMSLYDLQVEGGTAFGKWYGVDDDDDAVDGAAVAAAPGGSSSSSAQPRPALPSAEDCAFMYSYASGYLRSKNYEHYEISSYALRRGNDESGGLSHRSMHNQGYWQYDGQWYAVGLGATSNIDGVRFARPRALSDYVSWTKGLLSNDRLSVEVKPPWLRERPEDDDDDDDSTREHDRLLDVVMTRLRTSEGLDLDWVAEHCPRGGGSSCVDAILRGFALALELELGVRCPVAPHGKHGCIRLTDPRGFLFSNNIISNIFVELSEMDS